MCGNLVETVAALSRPRASRTESTGPALRSPGPRLRILVADDSATDRQIALALLRRLGQQADTAADGVQATAAAGKAPYDLILMDISMPAKDGLAATREIAAHTLDPSRPRIFAMTGGSKAGREDCKQAGMHGYLAKPVRLDQLAALLAACRDAQPN